MRAALRAIGLLVLAGIVAAGWPRTASIARPALAAIGPCVPGFSQAPGSPVVVGVDPRFVASGSIDGPASGTPDLAVANFGSGDVSVLLGNGDGSFVTFALAVGINPSGVAIGDLDFDGLSDLAVANSGSNSVTVLLNTCPLADLGAGLADTPDPVAPGADLTYTLTAQNLGPDVAMSVTLTDPLPAGTTFASLAAPAGWAWATPAIGAGGTITCTIGALPVGATRTARVNVAAPTVASGSTIQNTATIDGQTSDPTGANNSATATTSVLTPLEAPGPPAPPAAAAATSTPTATPTPTSTPTSTPTATLVVPRPENEDKDKPHETETERQQRERTNQLGLDDYRIEGNVVEVNLTADEPYAVIATRDGLVHVVLPCKPGCPKPEVGDYLEADGEKVHEYLFIAESVTLTRNGRRVR